VSNHTHAYDTACTECVSPLLAAIDLYHDDFLCGFTLPDCPAFDEWRASQTDMLRDQLIDCFRKVITYATAQHDLTHARQYTQRWVALCPWSEVAHRELMRVYALNHQRSEALQQYQTCVRMLQEEFWPDVLIPGLHISSEEVYESLRRIKREADYIVTMHDQKTFERGVCPNPSWPRF
jgi:DNA-binding SARP family transcriptional activator